MSAPKKWEVKPGGSGAIDMATATAMKNAKNASQAQSLRYNPGQAHAPTIDAGSSSIAHAMSVPDSKHTQLEFQKGTGESKVGVDSFAVSSAMKAPAPPRTINTVDKTRSVTSQPGMN
ncbi:uncharacterized protein MONBRDRAFT_32545 [Monosiga brevicollis MX1]|uniref:Uncharacterized protein n=1 Tax=Monosiga brevicollis TaxID=81824 RepID=A9V083_MONBE|nr:uncharacterized protein MONBRDRAFT_32545 [Monosiga brevicollis MX1]EDQ88966.1 predicted protein [Monosiga brevicollis MX1]|eukprot:XP_001746071.1 hypothetical protein [Monosiga brevicollis MX1]